MNSQPPTKQPHIEQAEQRSISIKSVLLGLAALALIILLDDYNAFYLKQKGLNAGYLPPGPIMFVLGAAVLWNPLWKHWWLYLSVTPLCITYLSFLIWSIYPTTFANISIWVMIALYVLCAAKPLWSKLRAALSLNSRELILASAIVLCGCWAGGAGLAQFHSYTHIIPWTKYETNTHQQKYKTLEYVPKHLWPNGGLEIGKDSEQRTHVYEAFLTGNEQQGTSGTPWSAWSSTLSHWIPMIICFTTCLIGLSMFVHKQWSQHEQLAYPLARITSTLFKKEDKNHLISSTFYNRIFWGGFLLSASVFLINMLHKWFPSNFPSVALQANFNFLLDIFPTLAKSGAHQITRFNFSFCAVGICYFLSREIGFTLGISKLLLAFIGVQVYLMTGSPLDNAEISFSTAGAYCAYAFIILYTGRHYYRYLAGKAFASLNHKEEDSVGIWGLRILALSFIGLIICLITSFELDSLSALLFAGFTILSFLVFTRIICETGIPYLQIPWAPNLIVSNLFGIGFFGPAALVIMNYIQTAMFMDAKNAMMPFFSNSMKVAQDHGIKLKRISVVIIITVAIAAIFSLFSRLDQRYEHGANIMQDGFGKNWVQNNFLNRSTDQLIQLHDTQQLSKPGEAGPGFFDRLAELSPDSHTVIWMLIGAAGVALLFWIRYRFPGFLLHPVLLLIWGTFPVGTIFYSFLIGWFIRELIIKYGGDTNYQLLKPFFIGIIIGEISLITIECIIGMSYHSFTGLLPPKG